MDPRAHRRFGALLAATVAVFAILSAVLLFIAGAEPALRGEPLDSRVTCDKLGPRACDPSVAAVPRALRAPTAPSA